MVIITIEMENLANGIRMQNPLAKMFFPWTVLGWALSKVNICSLTIFFLCLSAQFPLLIAHILPLAILIKLIRLQSNSAGLQKFSLLKMILPILLLIYFVFSY